MRNLIKETEQYVKKLVENTEVTPRQQKAIEKTFSKLLDTANLTPYKNEIDKQLVLKLISKRRKKMVDVGIDSDNPIFGFLNTLESFLNMDSDKILHSMFGQKPVLNTDKILEGLMNMVDSIPVPKDLPASNIEKRDSLETEKLLKGLLDVVGKVIHPNDSETPTASETSTDSEDKNSFDIAKIFNEDEPDSGVRVSGGIEVFIYKQGENAKMQVRGLPNEIDFEEFKKFLKFSGLWKTKEQLLKMKLPIKLPLRVIYSRLYITGLVLVKDQFINQFTEPVIKGRLTITKFNKKTGKLEIPSFINQPGFKIKDIIPSKKVRNYLKNLSDVRSEIYSTIVPNSYAIDDNNNLFHTVVPYIRES